MRPLQGYTLCDMGESGQVLSRELLASVDLKVLTVQRTEAGRWWNYRQVLSPFSRLWLILDGRATVRHHDRDFALTPGTLHLVPAFTSHDCACPRRFDHYHLHFASRLPTGIELFSMLDCDFQLAAHAGTIDLLQRLEKLYPNRKLPCFDPFREEYRRFPARAEQATDEINPADWFEAQGILKLLLAPFLKSARRHEGIHGQAAHRFLAVQEFIQEHMHQPITLADMARVADLHPTYFSDRFDHLVGVRPMEYLQRRRLERAQYLLVTTRAPIKEIAYQVGIPDAAYFTRVFARLCQSSPSAYRASHGV
jgi:AraC-like DNA-binding protein/mannose-6-phosphate isomerase-like protein (cupin superfamily)